MRVGLIVVGVALLVSGCSKSSVQLLTNGDPKVCAASDVTSQLFEIIRQHAIRPPNNGFVADYENAVQRWLKKVTLTIDNVTSTSVDAPNRKITCDGQVHIMGEGINDERIQSVEYDVTTDLSSNGKIIVSANSIMASGAVTNILAKIAEPDQKIAKAAKEKHDKIVGDDFDKKWTDNNGTAIWEMKTDISSKYADGKFSEKERAIVVRALVLDAECSSASGVESSIICARRQEYNEILRGHNICHYDGDVWIRCRDDGITFGQLSIPQFTAAERDLMSQADAVSDQCRDAHPEVCGNADALIGKLNAVGICWGAEDMIEAEKHWIKCGG